MPKSDPHAAPDRAATDGVWVDIPVSLDAYEYLIEHAQEKGVNVDEIIRLLIERYEDG